MTKKPEPHPPDMEDGDEVLKRLAILTRKLVAVPKTEIPKAARSQPEPHD